MPAVAARGVWKTFDRVRWVLEDVSLEVESGELVVLMGRSGSGKSTLLHLMAGLDEPTRGRVFVGTRDVGGLDDDARTAVRLREVGVVFQRFHLIPELTVFENVRLPMRIAKRADADARTKKLLAFFGLQEQAEAFPATLSGGETQRVAVARALANEPRVVLADEPTANLDEDNARSALRELQRVAKDLGTAVLVASHDPLSGSVADRVVRIVDGRLSADAHPAPRAADPTPPGTGRVPPAGAARLQRA